MVPARNSVSRTLLFLPWLGALLFILGCPARAPEHQRVTPRNGEVVLPYTQIADGEVHFFTFRSRGRNVNFFVRSDGEGRLHAHFDACYSCFKYKKGYIHEGEQVVCIACRVGYALKERTWNYVGACAPMPLRSSRTDGGLVIKQEDLERGRRYF